jgi:hypothetical protein
MSTKPACFPTIKLFEEWKDLARTAKEPCTICGDCSAKYRYDMKEQGRCNAVNWSQHVFGENLTKTKELAV